MARSWKRALKFAAITTLDIQTETSLFVIAVAVVTQMIKPNFKKFVSHIAMNVTAGLLTWAVLLSALLPLLAAAVLVRHFWLKTKSISVS